MNGNGFQRSTGEAHAPHWFSYQMNFDERDEIAAEYLCKRVLGGTADHAKGAELGKPRKVGIITESAAINEFRTSGSLVADLKKECGAENFPTADVVITGGSAEAQAALSTAIAKMRQEGVTTISLTVGAAAAIGLMSFADAQAYYPEWVLVNSYGIDINGGARLLPQTQMAQAFGMSGWEVPRPFPASECYRAYKSIDPANAPDEISCTLLYMSIEHTVNGIQMAGPKLTPKTFEQGLFAYGYRKPVERWAISGGYAPGDRSFVDTFGEVWWDATVTDPAGGEPGAWRWTNGAKRYGRGEIPKGPSSVFKEGVTSVD